MTEFILMYIVAAVIMCMLTGSMFYLGFAAITIFMVFVAIVSVYFLISVYKLLRTKACIGEFVKIADVKKSNIKFGGELKYKVAVYRINGREYEAAFPAEGLFGVYFYRRTKNCRLWLYEKEDMVFDSYNVASCIVWPAFCAVFLAAAVYMLKVLIDMRFLI